MAATLNLLIIRELKYIGFITNNLLLVAEEYVFDVEIWYGKFLWTFMCYSSDLTEVQVSYNNNYLLQSY